MSAHLEAPTADAMRALGGRFAGALQVAAVTEPLLITLSGDLGAGKTTFVAGLLAALGHAGAVRSPTYTLIEPYRLGTREVYHCDLYRLRHPDELDDLGLREGARDQAVLLVEWPERAAGRLGTADVMLHFAYAGEAGRTVEWEAQTPAGRAVLDHI